MPRRKAPLQVNQFTGGLNTELGPLSDSAETTQDELNMNLNRDGSRSKRLGFDLETSYSEIDTGVAYDDAKVLASTTFKWDNAGGDPDKSLLVVQVANSLSIYDLDSSPISGDQIYTTTFSSDSYSVDFSYSLLGELLVVVTGDKEINIYEYDGSTITASTQTLYVRDLFGVDAFEGATNLTSVDNINTRPTSLEETHVYNLRNQTFAVPRYRNNDETLLDPIDSFFSEGSTYPSNSDSVNAFLYADAADANDGLIERFFSKHMEKTELGSVESERGFFVIDAMERGTSRLAQEAALRTKWSELTHSVVDLPQDKTPGGPSAVEDFAGRFWFSGFSSEVLDGDSRSPKMGSYVLFSQVVKDKTNINRCYQAADPTSHIDNAIVDNDGGFIKLDEAYNITNLVSVAGSLFVFAENGIWRISGGDSVFSATSYVAEKLSSNGCISSDSVVMVQDSIYYWGEEAIYLVARNEFGIWQVQNISESKIQEFYRLIPLERKKSCSGVYDGYDRTVRWVYNTGKTTEAESKELRFSVPFGSFVPYSVPENANGLPKVITVGEVNPYAASDATFDVTVGGVGVTASSVQVTATIPVRSGNVRESVYVVVTDLSTNIRYSLGQYSSANFYDWESQNTPGVPYDAYLITQDLSYGDTKSRKTLPYVHTFFKRTETGFDANLEPTGASSCLFSARWDWSDTNDSKKWSTARQAYRYTQPYFPVDSSDSFETGFKLLKTRNKLRGSGQSVALKMEGEAGKDLHLYGWSYTVTSSRDE